MWATIGLVGGVLLTSRFLLWPYTPPVARADAVIVLSGDFGDRLRKGLEMMQAGVAPTLVIDGDPDFKAVADLCAGRAPFEVVCLRPSPDSTRAEARAAGRLVAERGWRSVAVVTNDTHVTRAGLLFRRCTKAEVRMVATHHPAHRAAKVDAIRHEVLGLAYAALRPGRC
jgi:uncharacterized SAM-binding protein YcdF (DUF218 family)